jgi:hypothetical protein
MVVAVTRLSIEPFWARETSACAANAASSSTGVQSGLNSINGLDDSHVSKSPTRNQ